MSSMSETTSELVDAGVPRGVIPPSGAGGRFLSDVIVGLGFADRETVDQALDGSRAPGKKLGNTLVEMGALSESQLGRAVAERYRLDFLDLSEFDIDPEAVHVIGDAEMRRYEAVPVAFTEDGALVVAMIDPADWLAAEEMAQLTGRRIRRAVAAPSQVIELIARVAEARSRAEDDGVDGSGASTASAMPSRLTLRPVTRPLAGPALGRAFGVEGALSGDPTPEGLTPRAPTEASVEPAALEPTPAPAPDEAAEGRVVSLTPETSEGAASPVRDLVEAPAPDAETADAPAEPALPVAAPADPALGWRGGGGEPEPSVDPAGPDPGPEEDQNDAGRPADEVSVASALEQVPFEPPTSQSPVDGPEVAFPEAAAEHTEAEVELPGAAVEPLDAELASPAPSQVQQATESHLSAPSPDAPTPAAPTPLSTDDRSQELEAVRAELTDARAELEEARAALEHGRNELESTRGELVSVRSRHDVALERNAETERLLAESRTQVGRLEAELAAAQEQAHSLREDLSWARGQIEQRGQREEEALTELRSHIEAMQGLRPAGSPDQTAPTDPAASPVGETPPVSAPADQSMSTPSPSEPRTAFAPSAPRPAAPSINGASAPLNGAAASKGPTSGGDRLLAPAEPEQATGTTKARGLKRLIAAVRRL